MSECFIALCDGPVDISSDILLITINVTKVQSNLLFNDNVKEYLTTSRFVIPKHSEIFKNEYKELRSKVMFHFLYLS